MIEKLIILIEIAILMIEKLFIGKEFLILMIERSFLMIEKLIIEIDFLIIRIDNSFIGSEMQLGAPKNDFWRKFLFLEARLFTNVTSRLISPWL